jgi:hypothetical protein
MTPALYRGGFLVVGVVSTGIVAGAAVSGTLLARGLATQPLRWIGERSYGIYLWHWPIFMVLRPGIDLDADGWTVQVLRFSLTLAAAELSYRYVEMPIRRGALGRAWSQAKESGRAGLIARSTVAIVTALAVVVGLGIGLSQAKEPTLQEALGGVDEVGGDLTATPTATSAAPAGGASSSSSPSSTAPGGPSSPPAPAAHVPPVLADGQDAFSLPTTAVGDSVMLAGYKALDATFPAINVDAKISRQPIEIYDRIRLRKQLGQLGDVVVIWAGTNGPIHSADLVAVLNLLTDRSRVVLITCRADRSWIKQSNAAIWAAYRLFKDGNVRVADWQSFSAGHPDWLYADGIHPKGKGAAAYASLVRQAVRA